MNSTLRCHNADLQDVIRLRDKILEFFGEKKIAVIRDLAISSQEILVGDSGAGEKSDAENVVEKVPSTIFEQTSDLRKEMEMTEHHETSSEVADRYGTSLTNGLTTKIAKQVSW